MYDLLSLLLFLVLYTAVVAYLSGHLARLPSARPRTRRAASSDEVSKRTPYNEDRPGY